MQKDVYYARVRNYDSALQAALFPDDVPQSVYDNLIKEVRRHLPALYRYYELRRRKMKLKQHYLPKILFRLDTLGHGMVKISSLKMQECADTLYSNTVTGLNGFG